MPGYPRELMRKTVRCTPQGYLAFVREELRMPSLYSVVNIHLFLPVFHLSPVECSFYFFCSGPSKNI